MTIDSLDPEIRRWLLKATAGTWAEMEAQCLARFGPDRAWSADLIATVWREYHPRRPGYRSAYETDAEVMTFIRQRADLVSADDILRAAGPLFHKGRFPSRSQLYRLIEKIRIQDRTDAIRAEMARGARGALQ